MTNKEKNLIKKFTRIETLYKQGKYEEFDKMAGKLTEDELGNFEMIWDELVEFGGTYEIANQAKNAWLSANM
jgi:hypothetical protein